MAGLFKGGVAPFLRVLRLMAGIGAAKIEVGAPDQEVKVKAAIRRGDQIPTDRVYAAVKAALEEGWGENMDPDDLMDAAAQAVEEEVRAAITEGRVIIDPKKRRHIPPKNRTGKPLLDTEALADSLKAEITK